MPKRYNFDKIRHQRGTYAEQLRYLLSLKRYKLGIGLSLLVIRNKNVGNQLAQPVSIISQGEIIRFPLCSFTQYMQVQAKNEKEK